MLREYFAIKVYDIHGNVPVAVIEPFDAFPGEEAIEDAIIKKIGLEGTAEVVKRYQIIVPFA